MNCFLNKQTVTVIQLVVELTLYEPGRMQKQTTERKLITHKHFEYFANKTQKLKGLQKCDLTNMVQSFRPRSDRPQKIMDS